MAGADDLVAAMSGMRLRESHAYLLYIDEEQPEKVVRAATDIATDTFLGYIEGPQWYAWDCQPFADGFIVIDDTYVIEAPNNILAYIREGSLNGLIRNCTLLIEGGPGAERIGMKTIEDIPCGTELSYFAGMLE